MSELERLLIPFARRVRFLRAWKGLAIGLVLGGAAAAVWAVLDLTGAAWAEWQWLVLVAAGAGLVGAAIGMLLPVRPQQVAASLDRRAGLKDRLGTAWERAASEDAFDAAQRRDAVAQLQGLQTKQAFPIKVTRLQYGALAAIVLAASVFLLGNTGVTLSPEQKKAKEALAKAAAQVERVAKPLEERIEKGVATVDEKNLARELERFSRELKRAKLTKEEAMRKANDLAEQAKKLGERNLNEARESLEAMQERFIEEKLRDAGLSKKDLETLKLQAEQQELLKQLSQDLKLDQMNKLSEDEKVSSQQMQQIGMESLSREMMNMSPEQREALMQEIERRMAERDEKMKQGGLSKEEMNKLKAAQEADKKMKSALELSEEAREALKSFMQSNESKELQELAQQMQEMAQQASEGKELTKEQMEQLQKAADEFAKQWSDPKKREEIKKQLQEMIEKIKNGEMSMQACQECLSLMGMGMAASKSPGFGSSGPGKDDNFLDTDKINLSDEEMQDPKRDSQATSVSGQRDPNRGQETFVELRAPTAPGSRTSVPYNKVLPKYKKQAEEAVNEEKVPEKHKGRVKTYFDSLTDGKDKSKDQGKK